MLSLFPRSTMSTPSPTTPPQLGVALTQSFSSPSRGIAALECDYDVNPSFLYQAIEAKQWDFAAKFSGKSDAQLQAATWVIRKEKNGKLRWRLLPIHAAIIFGSPLNVVELLLQEYPSGAQQKDDQGMLPIHLAFRNDADWDVLEELLTAHPLGVSVKDRKGRTPIQCASGKMSKRASVVELYTQIVVSGERQQAVAESRVAVESCVSSLQETQVNTLTTLKTEWEYQQHELKTELYDAQHALDITALRLEETSDLLAQKSAMEVELTHKLQMVTIALQKVNHTRTIEQSRATGNSFDEAFKTNTRVLDLQEANEELLVLVQTLLDQQTALEVQLNKQSWDSQDSSDKKEKLLRELTALEASGSAEATRERDIWRSKLGESNQQVSTKLKAVFEMMHRSSPKNSDRGGKDL
jgi:hypothetical protein